MEDANKYKDSNDYLKEAGVPDGSDDQRARWLQEYLVEKMKVPEYEGITIRVKKERNRYYVSEWRTGKQSFTGKAFEHAIARLSPIKDEPGQWQLAWMRSDRRWHNLNEEYRGVFEWCAYLIVQDSDGCFWG